MSSEHDETGHDETGPDGTRPSRRTPLTIFVLVAVLAYLLDQLVKQLSLQHLVEGEPVRLLGGLLTLRLLFNPGAAFGMGQGFTIGFTILAIVVLAVLLVRFAPRLRHRGWALAIGLLTAGVAGNLTDRLVRAPGPFRGHVVDMLQLPLFPAIFNVADICVTAAGVLIVTLSLFGRTGLDGRPVRS